MYCRDRWGNLQPNRTYMSKIEKGATWVGLEIIGKLAAVLKVEPAELLRLPPRRPRRR